MNIKARTSNPLFNSTFHSKKESVLEIQIHKLPVQRSEPEPFFAILN